MLIFVDGCALPGKGAVGGRGGSSRRPRHKHARAMAASPSQTANYFPFAVNCRLSKTFFGVPRKCNHCHKLIVLSAGYACQFCRFRCHKRCSGVGPHPRSRPKLCSLSCLPSGDSVLFGKILKENEINCNEVNLDDSDWASVLSAGAISDVTNHCSDMSISASPWNLDQVDDAPPLAKRRPSRPEPLQLRESAADDEQASVVDRFWRLLPWSAPPPLSVDTQLSAASASSAERSPVAGSFVATPVDDYNHSFLEQLFQQRSLAPSTVADDSGLGDSWGVRDAFYRRLNWVRTIAGRRPAQSEDCVADDAFTHAFLPRCPRGSLARNSSGSNRMSPSTKRSLSTTWPLSGLHVNHDDFCDFDQHAELASPGPSTASKKVQLEKKDWINTVCSAETPSSLPDLGEWAIDMVDVQLGEFVQSGRHAATFRGRWHGDVMIHRYEPSALAHFVRDVNTLAKIRHENVALFMGASVDPSNLAVVTSIRLGDTLFDTVHSKQRHLAHHSKANVAKQIAQGMGYLHAKGIVLRCLTSQNVYLERKVKVCTVDHGCARLRRRQLTYLSPELMTTLRVDGGFSVDVGAFSKQSDVYAFGTVLYELFAGRFPLDDEPPERVVWLIGSGRRQCVDHLTCHVALKSLIEDCWSPDFAYRPSFAQILKELHQTAALHKKHSSSEPDNLHRVGTATAY